MKEIRNRSFTMVIEGNPIAKMRARLACGFNTKRFYDAQQHAKQAAKIYIINQFGSTQQFQGPLSLTVTYYMPIRKSHIVPEGSIFYYKPDVDNLDKWTMDLLSHIAYHDDCQIADLEAHKRYSSRPRTELTIKELDFE